MKSERFQLIVGSLFVLWAMGIVTYLVIAFVAWMFR